MKNSLPIIFVVTLFMTLGLTLYLINQSEASDEPETWSSFVYTNGYNSGRYKKVDDFEDYPSCRGYSLEKSAENGQAPWECGLRCRFDSSRQGFQCETMENE